MWPDRFATISDSSADHSERCNSRQLKSLLCNFVVIKRNDDASGFKSRLEVLPNTRLLAIISFRSLFGALSRCANDERRYTKKLLVDVTSRACIVRLARDWRIRLDRSMRASSYIP